MLVTLLLTWPLTDCQTLQPRGYSLLLELVDSLPELFEGTVLRCLNLVELQNLRATCRLLRRVTESEALAEGTQARVQASTVYAAGSPGWSCRCT